MSSTLSLPSSVHDLLRCPICGSKLTCKDEQAVCLGTDCSKSFPIVNGIPILINEQNSVFTIADIAKGTSTFYATKPSLKECLKHLMPPIVASPTSRRNYIKFAKMLLERSDKPKVLVIGGGIAGKGMEPLLQNPAFELVETDIALGPRTGLVCDGHDLPFEDEVFDGVVAQAVLMHPVDPYSCVAEMHRVLNKTGLVYAETSHVQSVCGANYDFNRFTHLGHRRLFRTFEEIDSGVACGPGSALAAAWRCFLLSFTESYVPRRIIKFLTAYTTFYFKYFDWYLIRKRGSIDMPLGVYFLGAKSDKVLDDRELIKLYRGAY